MAGDITADDAGTLRLPRAASGDPRVLAADLFSHLSPYGHGAVPVIAITNSSALGLSLGYSAINCLELSPLAANKKPSSFRPILPLVFYTDRLFSARHCPSLWVGGGKFSHLPQ